MRVTRSTQPFPRRAFSVIELRAHTPVLRRGGGQANNKRHFHRRHHNWISCHQLVTLIRQKIASHETDEDHTARGLHLRLPHRVAATVPQLGTRHRGRRPCANHPAGKSRRHSLDIRELTVQPDHLHWFVSRPSNTEPAVLVNWVTRLCSRKDTHRHADHDGETLGWARDYSVGTAGHVSSETVDNDIQPHEGDES